MHKNLFHLLGVTITLDILHIFTYHVHHIHTHDSRFIILIFICDIDL